MSFMAAMAAAAPILLPAVIGAAGGAGLGALTSEDGFSDDDWWKGALAGGLSGGIGGGMGMFSPAGGGGLMGGSAIPSKLTAGLSSSPLPAGIPPTGGLDAFMSSIPTQGLSSPITATQGGALGDFMGSTSAYGRNFLGAPSGSMFGNISEAARGNPGALMPSNDTMMKGLLGSQIFKSVTPQSKPVQAGSINRGQRAAPFQPRQPIMMGGGRPQRRNFRR